MSQTLRRPKTPLSVVVDVDRADLLMVLPQTIHSKLLYNNYKKEAREFMGRLMGYLKSTPEHAWSLDTVLNICSDYVEVATPSAWEPPSADEYYERDMPPTPPRGKQPRTECVVYYTERTGRPENLVGKAITALQNAGYDQLCMDFVLELQLLFRHPNISIREMLSLISDYVAIEAIPTNDNE